MVGLFRNWQRYPKTRDPEIEKLEAQVKDTQEKIAELREQGRIRRNRRLESLDALETRRMTLTEIMKRMEKELADKDVDDYADILAESFGERTIFAHRAVGLEALLCQFMHQMLAKQHQLKIIKKWGKDLQHQYQKFKVQNKNEFHSFEALAVHCETMRLSLEAQYDDVFAAQHALLARFHQVEAGGNITNYGKVKSSTKDASLNGSSKSKLTVSTKHEVTPADLRSPANKVVDSVVVADDSTLMEEILLDPNDKESFSGKVNQKALQTSSPSISTPTKSATPPSPSTRGSESGQKSARSRRREIEQRRLAKGHGSPSKKSLFEEPDKEKARERMRELEAQKRNIASRTSSQDSSDSELRVRGTRLSSRRSSSKYGGNNDDDLSRDSRSRSSKESASHRGAKKTQSTDGSMASNSMAAEEEARRRRRERRQERASKYLSSNGE